MVDLTQRPQSTDQADMPVHPVVSGSANQTNMRTSLTDAINSVTPQGQAMSGFAGMFANAVNGAVAPVKHYAGGTDNVQPAPAQPFIQVGAPNLANAVNPDLFHDLSVAARQFSNLGPAPFPSAPRAVLPPSPDTVSGGYPHIMPAPFVPPPAPTPVAQQGHSGRWTYAPPSPTGPTAGQLFANPQVGIALLHGITRDHGAAAQALAGQPITPYSADQPAQGQPAQGQPVTQGGRSVTPPAETTGTYDNGNVRMTPGPVSYVGPAEAAGPNSRTVYAPGAQPQRGTPDHAMSNPGDYSPQEFHASFAGMPRGAFYKMLATAHARTVQEQAAGQALSMALRQPDTPENTKSTFDFVRQLAQPNTAIPGMGMIYSPNGQ